MRCVDGNFEGRFGLLVLLAVSVLQQNAATQPSDVAKPEIRSSRGAIGDNILLSEADEASLRSARQQIEAVPEADRVVIGLAISKSLLNEVESNDARIRILISIGDLHRKLKEEDEAREAYRGALAIMGSPQLKSIAIERLAQSNAEGTSADSVIAALDEALKSNWLPTEKTLEVQLSKAEILARNHRGADALAVIRSLIADEQLCDSLSRSQSLFAMVQSVASELSRAGERALSIELYRTVEKSCPTAQADPNFLSNLATILERGDEVTAALELRESLIKRFPQHRLMPSWAFLSAVERKRQGDSALAERHFQSIIDSAQATDGERELATANLLHYRKLDDPIVFTPDSLKTLKPAGRSWNSPIVLFIVNIGFVSVIVAVIFWRRKYR